VSLTGNGQTITTNYNSIIHVSGNSAYYSGIIMQAGGYHAQPAVVYNLGSAPFSFAASGTSNVKAGTGMTIAPGALTMFWWSAGDSQWYATPASVYPGTNSLPQVTTPAGLTSYVQQSQAAATSAVTVASSAAIASLGSLSVPASDPVAGAVYRFSLNGVLSIASATTATTYVCDMRWGGTSGTLLTSLHSTSTANSPLFPNSTALSSVPVLIEGEAEFRTSTTVTGWLKMTWTNSTTASTAATVSLAVISSAVTVTTSSAESLSVDWTWGTSSASNTITIESSVFERVA
jgi:hypothetical protein